MIQLSRWCDIKHWQAAPAPKPAVKKAPVASSGRFSITEGNAWDVEGASWAVNGGIFGRIGDGEIIRAEFSFISSRNTCVNSYLGS